MGNQVKDEYGEAAIFNELSSSPSSMEASKAADAYGMCPGGDCQLSDAEQAYIQSLLKGPPTWVRLPRDRWPQWWVDMGFKDPVCPLLRALYGHPDSGGYWEKHCEKHLLSVGFEPVQDWRSCFFHPGLKMFLVV